MQVAEKHHSDRDRPHWWTTLLLDPLIIALICICFFWKLVLTNQYTWLESPDLANQVLPWLQFQAGEWHSGHLPLWDPYLWNGQPLVGQAQPGAVYPLNWLLFSLPLTNGWIRMTYLHWYFVLIHWMGAVFCYWLCRDLDRSRIAAVFGGILFAIAGYMGRTDWPQMLNGVIWVPLVFLFLLRALSGRNPASSAALSGLFLGVAWLSGHHQAPIFLSLAVAGTWLYHLISLDPTSRSGARVHFPVVRLAAIALLFAFCAGAMQILPGVEYGKLAVRWVGADNPVGWEDKVPYTVHGHYSLNPVSILGIIIPGWHRNADAFIGVVALTIAALGTSLLWRRSQIRLFFALAVFGLLVSLGEADVLHGVLYALVPLVEKARAPSMAIFMFHFGIAVLSSYGIDVYQSAPSSPWASRIPRATALTGLFLILASTVRALFQGHQNFGDERVIVVAVCALLIAAVIYAWRQGTLAFPALAVCSFGLMLVDVGLVTNAHLPHRSDASRNVYLKRMVENQDVVAFLRTQGLARVELDDRAIPYNLGDWEGLETYRGYLASLTANLTRLETDSPWTPRLFGVKYSVRKSPQSPGQKLVYRGASGLNVYLNPGVMPRAWSVHGLVELRYAGEIPNAARTLDPRESTFVLGPAPKLATCSGDDEVRILRHTANHVSLHADMMCEGMVILGDTAFPGWIASVDGRRVAVYDAYTALRGVVVSAGSHRIDFVYRPNSILAGATLSLLAVLAAIAWTLIDVSRRLRPHLGPVASASARTQ